MEDATLMTSELLKWTRRKTHQKIATIMDQAIKQGFLEDWLMNWIKPINKRGDKKFGIQLSN